MNWLQIIGIIIVLIGVIAIFDARLIVNKFFSFGDQNEATFGLKVSGFLLFVIGGLILLFN